MTFAYSHPSFLNGVSIPSGNGVFMYANSCETDRFHSDYVQVLIRFPTGERKERRFHSSAPITSLYDYVDSLDCLEAEKYSLVSNFPRVTYGPEKHSLTLEEAGLHPQASLFIEIEQ